MSSPTLYSNIVRLKKKPGIKWMQSHPKSPTGPKFKQNRRLALEATTKKNTPRAKIKQPLTLTPAPNVHGVVSLSMKCGRESAAGKARTVKKYVRLTTNTSWTVNCKTGNFKFTKLKKYQQDTCTPEIVELPVGIFHPTVTAKYLRVLFDEISPR